MELRNLKPVIVIVGPTAAGKTSVAIEIAERIGAEIISADSRQIYKLLDIGTAKPTPEERARVPHHFVDMLPLDCEYSAGHFSREARAKIHELIESGKRVVVVGGSGMYMDALLNGFFEPKARDKKLQNQLKQKAKKLGGEVLHAELQKHDPERAAELSPNDTHRIVRALEIFFATGIKHSELIKQPRIPADFPFQQFALDWDRQKLYQRIETRVYQMLEAGLLDEIKSVLQAGYSPEINALQTVGYREPMQFLNGEMSYDEMVDKIKQHTRNYAKRQITWFRRDKRITWLDAETDVRARILNHSSRRSGF